MEVFRLDEVKEPHLTDSNRNGRVPAIQDPNEDLALWVSGAIYQYVVEVYDKEHRLSYATLKEKHLCNQWLHFQMGSQGPYFGQLGWFNHLHREKIPSAIDRYANEVRRVLQTIETALAAKPADAQWLVGNKMTFADMAFVPWSLRLSELTGKEWGVVWYGLPHAQAWHEKMAALDSWKRCMQTRAQCMDAQPI
jgi:glutathione S-transferase